MKSFHVKTWYHNTDSSDEHKYSFECNKDVITMGNIEGDKTVSFLVPHSDASAFTAMVRLLSSRLKWKLSLSWLESQSGSGISNDGRAVNNTDFPIFKSIGYCTTDFCQCRGLFSWKKVSGRIYVLRALYSKLCRLISKFSVSSTSHQHVRIADVSLDLPSGGLDGVEIMSASSKRPVVVS